MSNMMGFTCFITTTILMVITFIFFLVFLRDKNYIKSILCLFGVFGKFTLAVWLLNFASLTGQDTLNNVKYWTENGNKKLKLAVYDALADGELQVYEYENLKKIAERAGVQKPPVVNITLNYILDDLKADQEIAEYVELTNAKKFVFGR